MKLNPYNAPSNNADPLPIDGAELPEARRDIGETLAWFALFSGAGGGFSFASYIATAMYLERNVLPRLDAPIHTYGQQFGMISLPLATLIGIGAGLGFAFFVVGWRRMAKWSMFAVAILGALQTFSLWYRDGLGECNSAIVLYYPIFGLSGLVAIGGIVLVTYDHLFPKRSNRIVVLRRETQ